MHEGLTVSEAIIDSLLGFAVVFIALAVVWVIITTLAKAVGGAKKPAPAAGAAAPAAAPAPAGKPAPGSAGEIKLYTVPEKQAAMVMAIVADKMGKPLNELRFKSIKEVK